jgi:methionyl aminopeptidase
MPQHQPLLNASEQILFKAIQNIKEGVRISEIGRLIEESDTKKAVY